MSYARARLWVGITAVGLNVLIAIGVLVFGSRLELEKLSVADSIIWVPLAAYVLWMIPFDFLGGWWLPNRYGRSEQGLGAFVRDWACGTLLQSLVFVACGTSVLWAARGAGLAGGVLMLLILFGILLVLRPFWLHFFSRASHRDATSDLETIQQIAAGWGVTCRLIAFRSAPTSGFTGGIVGLVHPQIIFPDQWRNILTLEELAALAARRSITLSTGSRKLGLIFAAAWTVSAFLAGNWIASTLPHGPQTMIEFIQVIAGATLWNFVGLLLLPTISRFAARRLDGMTRARVPKLLLEAAQKKVDQVQDNEPDRPRGIELIFHPVPSVALRQQQQLTTEGSVPWHVPRQVLFLSWALCNPLARAVHCNAGQSLLWVCPPTD